VQSYIPKTRSIRACSKSLVTSHVRWASERGKKIKTCNLRSWCEVLRKTCGCQRRARGKELRVKHQFQAATSPPFERPSSQEQGTTLGCVSFLLLQLMRPIGFKFGQPILVWRSRHSAPERTSNTSTAPQLPSKAREDGPQWHRYLSR